MGKMTNPIIKTYGLALAIATMSLDIQGGPDRVNNNRIKEIIKYFLSNSDYLSEQRIHQLLYLTELEMIREERPLGADFKPFIDGIYSEEVEEVLSELSNVSKETVRVGGKRVNKYTGEPQPSQLDEFDEDVARQIYNEYGDLESKKLMNIIRDTRPFSATKFGEKMGLHTLSEETDQGEYTLF